MSGGKLQGTFDFSKVSLVFGTRALEGFGEGSEIKVSRDENSFNKKVGNDGNITRSRSNNNSGMCEFVLDQFSKDNKYLQTIMNLDERTGKGILPFKLVDNSNPDKEIALGLEAWLEKPSDKSYSNESGDRPWKIVIASLNFIQTDI